MISEGWHNFLATHQTYVRFPRFYQERTEDSERKESNQIQVLLLTLDSEVPGVQGYNSVNIDSLNTSSCAFLCPRPPCRPLLSSVAHCRCHAAHQTYVRFPRFYQEEWIKWNPKILPWPSCITIDSRLRSTMLASCSHLIHTTPTEKSKTPKYLVRNYGGTQAPPPPPIAPPPRSRCRCHDDRRLPLEINVKLEATCNRNNSSTYIVGT